MKKKNGYVFMETIVVISVLTLTLVLLYASFSFILRKSRLKNTFDTTELIYKTYYINQILNEYKAINSSDSGILYYAKNHLGTNQECKKQSYGGKISYICDLSASNYSGYLFQIKTAYEVDKIIYLNPYEVLSSTNKNEWLNNFDATTIDYINSLGTGVNKNLMIVKYNKNYDDDRKSKKEVMHSSLEV